MEGALHFPSISAPPSPWLTRSLLYWDEVGTIVPQDWIESPEELGPHTQELVRRGLVRQVFPEEAADQFEGVFLHWLARLDARELSRRQDRFAAGDTKRIHYDKWMFYGGGLADFAPFELTAPGEPGWLEVERATADDFMAGLALGLCHPDAGLHRATGGEWVPATNDPAAFQALLDGLEVLQDDSTGGRTLQLRVKGEIQASRLRTSLLDGALPVPDEDVSPDALERFRRRYVDKLPACRRRVEEVVDAALVLRDEVLEFRAIDRVNNEVAELATVAETYLREAGIRRVSRSPLTRMLKVVPALRIPATVAQDTAASLETATRVETEPLAYLAFARAELGPDATYGVRRGGLPLTEAVIGSR